jgi:MFS family permease
MREILVSIAALCLGVTLLQLGNGMFSTLLAVRLDLAGFAPSVTGMIMSAYYVGLTVGALRANVFVEQVGHIRAFAAFAAMLSVATLIHVLVVEPTIWMAARGIGGFCVAGLLLVVESWLNGRATARTRGKVLSAYHIVVYAAMAGGQLLLALDDPGRSDLFVIAAMLMTLALVPVALTRAPSPPVPEPSGFGFRRLYKISPLGVVGAVTSGLMQGAFYGLAPVFAQRTGLSAGQVGLFMSVAILGSLALQWPLGMLSDRFDRRGVLIACAFLTAPAALAVTTADTGDLLLLLPLVAVYSGLASTVYPTSVAHANDYVAAEDIVGAAGGLLFAYSLGAVVGPLAAAQAIEASGPAGLFYFNAVIAVGFGLFGVWRMTRRAALPKEEQGPWVPLPRTTPMVYELDPRAEPEAEAPASDVAPAAAKPEAGLG